MPRSQIRGTQVKDASIRAIDLAIDSVITEKIKDKNVTKPKLTDDIVSTLLSSSIPVVRTVIRTQHLAHTNFTIPDGAFYNPPNFMERVLIYRNGQLLYNGLSAPLDESDDVTDVYPGDDNSTQIKFTTDLLPCDVIQVVIL